MNVHTHAHTQRHTHQNYKFLKKGRQYLTGELLFNKNDESQETMSYFKLLNGKKKTDNPIFLSKIKTKYRHF